ncbi:MAG: hypothetical protein LBH75_00640 [Treponema sp.]|nr:hypothetical protein [Treponema sp.]
MSTDYLALIDAASRTRFKFMIPYGNQKRSGGSPEWLHVPSTALGVPNHKNEALRRKI